MAEVFYVTPRPTYFVPFAGNVNAGEFFEIPDRHQREGDTENNRLVRVVLQNNSASTGIYVTVHDKTKSDTECARIGHVANNWQPVEIVTDTALKLSASASVATYIVMAFYAKPLDR